jgi:hypothetical protein
VFVPVSTRTSSLPSVRPAARPSIQSLSGPRRLIDRLISDGVVPVTL